MCRDFPGSRNQIGAAVLVLLKVSQGGFVGRNEFLFGLYAVKPILLEMRLDPFGIDLVVFWHMFHDGGWRRMLQTHIKDGRNKIAV